MSWTTKLLSLLVLISLLLPIQQATAQSEQIINVISDQEFRNLRTSDGKLDQALAAHYPEWANYTQMAPWSTQPVTLGKIIVSVSHDEESNLQINPAVTLVTLGDSLDWQSPSNTDLYLKSQEISTELNRLSFAWENPFDDSLRRQYPEIANSGTYALYAFFNHNLDRLQSWQQTYRGLFGEELPQANSTDAGLLEATDLEPFLALPFEHPETKFWTVNSFFDHQSPLYAEDTAVDILYRFDGTFIQKDDDPEIFVDLNNCARTVSGATCYSGHDGIDYNLPVGEPVLAAAAGTVITGDPTGDGTVIIEHANGLWTIYMHMSAVYVDFDDPTKNTVNQGDVIGEAGEEGEATGPHLHFGVRQPDNQRMDIDPFGWWSLDPDPWSTYDTYGQTSTWLWKGDEAGDGYLTVDNRESQAQFFLPPSSAPPAAPEIGWHRLTTGYDGEAWYSFMHTLTDDLHKYWAIWGSTIEQPGEYTVQAYWPEDPDPGDEWQPASNARYTLYYHQNGALQKVFLYGNQTVGADQFNPLCKEELVGGNCPADQIARFSFGQGATTLTLENPALYDTSQHRKILFYDAVQWQQDAQPTPTPTLPPNTHVVRVSVNKGSDDAGTNPTPCVSNVTDNEVYLGACFNGDDIKSGFRFENIQIPRGANIESAYVHFTADGTYTVPVQVRIYGENSGNPLTFSASNPPASRSTTSESNSVSWDITNTWVLGESWSTPDISSVIQEIVSQGYWNSGQPISVIIKNAGSSNLRRVIAFERASFDPQLEPAELEITYSFDGTPPPTGTPVTSTPTPVPTNTPTPISTTPAPACNCILELFGSCQPATFQTAQLRSINPYGTQTPMYSTFGLSSNIDENFIDPIERTGLIYRIRDEIISNSNEGQRLTSLYYNHSAEIAALMLSDIDLYNQGFDTLDAFLPGLQAMVDGNGNTVAITAEQIEAAQAFLNELSARGSSELQQSIQEERERHPFESMIGMTMDDAWAYLNGYQFEWLKPISNSNPYEAKPGPVIPIQFRLTDTQGNFVSDESVRIELVDSNGNVVIGPITLGNNHTNEIVIQNHKYHYNLETKGLKEGFYTLKVYYNSVNQNEPYVWGIKINSKKK